MTKYYCKPNWRIPGCAHTMCSFWDTSFVFQISVFIIHLLISLFLILSFIPFIEYMALQERKRWVNPYVSSMLIRIISVQFSLVQLLSHLWLFATHEPQHTRPPCPSPTPGVYQTHVHWVSDATHPSHPLSPPSPPVPNPFQHQGLFQRVNSSHEVAKVLYICHQITNPWSMFIMRF